MFSYVFSFIPKWNTAHVNLCIAVPLQDWDLTKIFMSPKGAITRLHYDNGGAHAGPLKSTREWRVNVARLCFVSCVFLIFLATI